jgi:hypothetical protein
VCGAGFHTEYAEITGAGKAGYASPHGAVVLFAPDIDFSVNSVISV